MDEKELTLRCQQLTSKILQAERFQAGRQGKEMACSAWPPSRELGQLPADLGNLVRTSLLPHAAQSL